MTMIRFVRFVKLISSNKISVNKLLVPHAPPKFTPCSRLWIVKLYKQFTTAVHTHLSQIRKYPPPRDYNKDKNFLLDTAFLFPDQIMQFYHFWRQSDFCISWRKSRRKIFLLIDANWRKTHFINYEKEKSRTIKLMMITMTFCHFNRVHTVFFSFFPIIRTAAKSQVKINYRCLSEIDYR